MSVGRIHSRVGNGVSFPVTTTSIFPRRATLVKFYITYAKLRRMFFY